MLQYIARRLLWMIPTMFGVTLVIFFLIQAAPGDPATMKYGHAERTQQETDIQARIDKFNSRYGFNQPYWKQYLSYVGPLNLRDNGHTFFGGTGEDPYGGLLLLDLGHEFQRPSVAVMDELKRRLKVTVPLAAVSVFLSYLIALPLGVASAVRQGTRADSVVTVVLFILYSIPRFWGGLMLILIFGAAGLDLLPTLGLHDKDAANMSPMAYAWDTIKHTILPIVTLTYGTFAYLSRQMRVGVVDAIRQDYVRTARAKGLSEQVVVFKHVLRNSLIPVLTLLAAILPLLIGGSLIVEKVFDVPGMGLYAFEGLVQRDYNIVMATTTFSALMTMLGILMSDISYALVDPRIRYD